MAYVVEPLDPSPTRRPRASNPEEVVRATLRAGRLDPERLARIVGVPVADVETWAVYGSSAVLVRALVPLAVWTREGWREVSPPAQ